ncbi:MAG: CCA tRNA nucleotidyltransferase [Hyphomicrobiales bacterium]|nr:CCA tRNA nucleotidyltransferase [Hyphomicrobiales bacterium]
MGGSKRPPSLSPKAAPWLAEDGVRAVFAALSAAGHEARVVGGAVRNALLQRPVSDIDFAATATPMETESACLRAGLRVIPTGVAHGTVTVIAGGRSFEVTTLREDVETDGRHAVVRFGRDWRRDAERRDFTMNALYAEADGRIFDPIGGLPDALARRVRFIGDARQRIREDYLRSLRFFRFHAQYGRGAIDRAGLDAALAERSGLRRLSAERVRAETFKLLAAPGAADAVEAMSEFGVLDAVLPGPVNLARLNRMAALDRRAPDPLRRLAALTLFAEEDAERLGARLRLSNREAKRLAAMARFMRFRGDEKAARRALYALGPELYADAIAMAQADAGDKSPRWRGLRGLPLRWTAPRPPVSGADLAPLGFHGPALGAALRRVEALWIEADFTADRAALLRAAARMAESKLPEEA